MNIKPVAFLVVAAVLCGCATQSSSSSPVEAASPARPAAPATQATASPANAVAPVPSTNAVKAAIPASGPLKVGVYADRGPGGIGAVEWFRLVEESPEMRLTLLDGADVRAGRLEGLDVLVMPGGNSVTEYETLGKDGVAKMKDFMRKGGGYIGTCAGCCLLMDGHGKRANVIPWNSKGHEDDLLFPQFLLTPAGQKALGLSEGPHVMRYHGGPFMWPTTNRIEGADVALWGTYNAEATFRGKLKKEKKMFGAAAIVGGTYGKGRLFATAAHPEYFDSTLYVVKAAFKYVTGRDVTFPTRARTPRALSVGFLTKGIGGKATAQTALALAREKDFDLVPIDMDGIFRRGMDHVDVLVVLGPVTEKDKKYVRAIATFEARGGKTLYCCGGVKTAPKGAATSTSGDAVVEAVRKLAADGR